MSQRGSSRTPSQTIGPFFGFALPWPGGPLAVTGGAAGAIHVFGRIYDGRGDPVPDALIETWQADPPAFARCPTDADGRYDIVVPRPRPVRDRARAQHHAPYLAVSVFARGLLKRAVTRVYFADEEPANAADPVLALIADEAARATLIAARDADGRYQFDVHLQGERETVFFDFHD